MPIKLTLGSSEEIVFTIPEAHDDDFEDVQISINMDNIDHFAVWNPDAGTVTFKLVTDVITGLHRTPVILSDGRLTNEYQLYIYISDGTEEDIDEIRDQIKNDEDNSADDLIESTKEGEEEEGSKHKEVEENEMTEEEKTEESTNEFAEQLARIIRERVDR